MYDLPVAGMVRLRIYNLLGQEVRSIQHGWQEPGRYNLIWNSRNNQNRNVGSGVYFYILETQDFNKTKKMMLLK